VGVAFWAYKAGIKPTQSMVARTTVQNVCLKPRNICVPSPLPFGSRLNLAIKFDTIGNLLLFSASELTIFREFLKLPRGGCFGASKSRASKTGEPSPCHQPSTPRLGVVDLKCRVSRACTRTP